MATDDLCTTQEIPVFASPRLSIAARIHWWIVERVVLALLRRVEYRRVVEQQIDACRRERLRRPTVRDIPVVIG